MSFSNHSRENRAAWITVYEQGPDWRRTRDRFWAVNRPACAACGRTKAQGAKLHVHHRSSAAYDASWHYPGREWLTYFVGLCTDCHKRVHYLEDNSSLSLEQATDLVLRSAPTISTRQATPTTTARQPPGEPARTGTPGHRQRSGAPAMYFGNQDGHARLPCDPAPAQSVYEQWAAYAERNGIPLPEPRPTQRSPWVQDARDAENRWETYKTAAGIALTSALPPARHRKNPWIWVWLLVALLSIGAGVYLYWP